MRKGCECKVRVVIVCPSCECETFKEMGTFEKPGWRVDDLLILECAECNNAIRLPIGHLRTTARVTKLV